MGTISFVPPKPEDKPELFFALVGPIGTDLHQVVDALKLELNGVGYSLLDPVKLSGVLQGLRPFEGLRSSTGLAEDERVKKLMDAGDAVRKDFQHGGALAALAVAEVTRRREEQTSPRALAYVFHSLKHPKEVELLRAVYGASLVVIAVYETEESRRRNLVYKLQRTRSTTHGNNERATALIERDQDGGEDKEFGQNVRKTFPLADFFLDATNDLRGQVARLVHLVFGHPHLSPTRHEYAMFMAQAAALRSADMSRQVGAVLVDEDGEVIAAGCNEVPKPGGGIYWSGDHPDCRDFTRGSDPNAIMGRELLNEVFSLLKDQGWLEASRADEDPVKLVDQAEKLELFEQARVGNLIEFGRVVHAEMNALVYAARRGIRTDKRRLYCTTFPCHGCARHIIGAGIAEVVYIEPYPKSLAVNLYPEAISLGPGTGVAFLSFTGVAPRRYLELFGFGRRKDSQGYAMRWDATAASPRTRQIGAPHRFAEKAICATLDAVLKDRNWID